MSLMAVFGALFALVLGDAAAADELYGTLKKIKDSGSIVIGRSEQSVPFSYLDDTGEPIGYSIDLCARIVDAVKAELKLDKIEVKYVTVMGTTLIPLIVNGTVDMACTTTTMTLARRRQVDFLSITYITGNQLLVRKDSGIHEVEDLKGKRVSVNQGTQNEKIIKALDEKEKLWIQFLLTEDQPHGWLSLESDRVDAYVPDAIVEHGLIHASAHPEEYEVVGRLLSYDPYSIVIRRDDSAFRLVGIRALAELFRSGEIDKIYDKWLAPIAGPPSEMLKTVWASQAFPP
ncbi:MAG: amino acid ABC transporter substrate-binding protein [Alphaproteobacteria bacterium]|nr:amino acid ABC transporter substrate-binding protein [Alphaproteobacteria bacterium]